jgi:hypothetical protein
VIQWLTQWWQGLVHMIGGPGHLRFVLQHLVALFLGVRDGRLDARAHTPPYLWRILFDRGERRAAFRSAAKAVGIPFLIATVIDGVLQLIILGRLLPGAAMLTGGLLVGLPYALVRALTNRFASQRRPDRGEVHGQGGLPA